MIYLITCFLEPADLAQVLSQNLKWNGLTEIRSLEYEKELRFHGI